MLALITRATLGPVLSTALIRAGFVSSELRYCTFFSPGTAPSCDVSEQLLHWPVRSLRAPSWRLKKDLASFIKHIGAVFFSSTHCSETALSILLSLRFPLVFNEYLGECDVRMTWHVYFRICSETNQEEHFGTEPRLFVVVAVVLFVFRCTLCNLSEILRISRTWFGIKGFISRDGNIRCKRGRRGESAVGVFEKKSWTLGSDPCQSGAIIMTYIDAEIKRKRKRKRSEDVLWGTQARYKAEWPGLLFFVNAL